MRKKTMTVGENNAEYKANIAFARDEIMSPDGVDWTPCRNTLTGETWVEICTKLPDGKFKIEIV